MKTIVFAATKGGTGKSSLAFNIGVEAAKHGSVWWVDMDPQKSLTRMVDSRSRQANMIGPDLLTDVENLAVAVRRLKGGKFGRDYLIADTPGSHMPIIENALRAADCVVLPVQPSPLDILAQEDVAPVIDRLGKGAQTLFVLNRIDGRASVDDVINRIGRLFPNPPARINQRQAYMRGAIIGKSGAEISKYCETEIGALWAAISRILEKGA